MQTSPTSAPERRPRWLVPVLAAALVAGCGATGSVPGEATPYEPPEPHEEAPIGFYLSRIDGAVRAWTNLKLDPGGQRDKVKVRGIERDLQYTVTRRQDEILEELESGPPKNRSIAAVALGFTGDPTVLSPLLAAVDDPDPEVANNALLGIGILGDPETPLTQIAWILSNHQDAWVRVNAAYAIHRVVSAGGRSDVLPAACRQSLGDEEPGVRAQGAAILGLLVDDASVAALGDLLYDPENLVASAAVTSLARIGRENVESKGTVARQLVEAMERRKDPVRSLVRRELARLSGGDLGGDVEAWRDWAYRMP